MGGFTQKLVDNYLLKSDFLRNVITLMTGTAIAQVVPVLVSPILTRIYTPEDFSVFGIFFSTTFILSAIAGARYDLAIMLPKKVVDAKNLVVLTLGIIAVFSLLTMFVVLVFGTQIAVLLNQANFQRWIILIPFAIFFQTVIQLLTFWQIRSKKFKKVSLAKVIRVIVLTTINLTLGYFIAGEIGLIIGYFIALVVEAALLSPGKDIIGTISWHRIKDLSRRYAKFPKFDVPSALLNTASLYLPLFLLTLYFEDEHAGYYFQAHKVLSLPIGFFGASLGQVFFQKASQIKEREQLKTLIVSTYEKLLLLGFLPIGLIIFYGSDAFAFIFGETWRQAGFYAQCIAPWLLVNLISSPLSTVFTIFQKQKQTLLINIVLLLGRFSSIYLGYYQGSPDLAILYFGIFNFLIYLFSLAYIFSIVEVRAGTLLGVLTKIVAPAYVVLALVKVFFF